jgi:hypothetical protein
MVQKRYVEVDAAVVDKLSEGALSTTALAREISEERTYVFARCKRLQQLGRLESKLSYGRTLFCIDDDKVVTRREYDTCSAEGHELRTVSYPERIWRLA